MTPYEKDVQDMNKLLSVRFSNRFREFQEAGYNIGVSGKRRDNMLSKTGDYLESMRKRMDGYDVNLDPHKRAAVASALILRNQPVYFENLDSDAAWRNRLVGELAYLVGLDVLISYQIARDASDRTFRSEIFPKVKEKFSYPDTVSDINSVPDNLMFSLARLAEINPLGQLKNTLFLLSFMYFSLDLHSKDQVHNYVKQKYDDYRAAFKPPSPVGSYDPDR